MPRQFTLRSLMLLVAACGVLLGIGVGLARLDPWALMILLPACALTFPVLALAVAIFRAIGRPP